MVDAFWEKLASAGGVIILNLGLSKYKCFCFFASSFSHIDTWGKRFKPNN